MDYKFLLDIGLIILFVKPIPTWLYFTMLITSLLLMGYKTYFKAIFQSIHLKLLQFDQPTQKHVQYSLI